MKDVRIYLTAPARAMPERARLASVLDEANELKARVHGLRFRPAASALGRLRPRALRRRDLLGADLVVALLGQTWEEPAGQEFLADLALAREQGKDCWLYVRTLDDAALEAPEATLDGLLALRDRLERDRPPRYHRYLDTEHWQQQFLDHLFGHLDGLPAEAALSALPPGAFDDLRAEHLPAPLQARLETAERMAAEGRLTQAEVEMARAVAEHPIPEARLAQARLLLHLGAFSRAEALVESVLAGEPEATLLGAAAATLTRLGAACDDRAHLDAARRHFRRALRLYERLGNAAAEAAVFRTLGAVYHQTGDLEKAEHAFREALDRHERLGRLGEVAADCGHLGNVYAVWSRLVDAEACFRRALDISERLGRRAAAADQYGNLGILYRVQGRLDEAIAAYQAALDVHGALGHQEALAEDFNNLGNVYQEAGRLDEAETAYRKALGVVEELGQAEGMASQYGNLGVVYQARGLLDDAEAMYRKALAIFETLGAFVPIEQLRAWIASLEAQRHTSHA